MFLEKSISLGFIEITYYALCILLGAFVAYLLVRKEWIARGYNIQDINDFFFNVILIGIIGARLWYVIFMLPHYLDNPITIITNFGSGLAFHGGAIAGVSYGYYYFKKKGYDFWKIADIILPNLLIAQAIGRWGNFFNQEAFGSEVSKEFLTSLFIPDFIINKMFINGVYYHPTFLYESILCIASFIVIKLACKYASLKVGQPALLYGILYSFLRMVVEQLRMDSLLLFDIKTAQLLSLIIIVAGMILFFKFDKTHSSINIEEGEKQDG